jgi:hypothetical protein
MVEEVGISVLENIEVMTKQVETLIVQITNMKDRLLIAETYMEDLRDLTKTYPARDWNEEYRKMALAILEGRDNLVRMRTYEENGTLIACQPGEPIPSTGKAVPYKITATATRIFVED